MTNSDKNLIDEIQCDTCIHKDVCIHKDDFLAITDAIEHANIHSRCAEGMRSTPIKNFFCLGGISVRCKHHYRKTDLMKR